MAQKLVKNEAGVHEWIDAERAPSPGSRGTSGQLYTESKPHFSQAAGCLPSQVDEFNEMLAEQGLATSLHFMPDGQLRATSKEAFNEHLRHRGIANNDAGYSDYAGS